MQPSPIAETTGPAEPSLRVFIPSPRDLEVEHRRAERAQSCTQIGKQHLGTAGRGDIAEVDHGAPTEPLL